MKPKHSEWSTVNNVADACKFHGIQDYSSVDPVIFQFRVFHFQFKIVRPSSKDNRFHNYFKFLQQQFFQTVWKIKDAGKGKNKVKNKVKKGESEAKKNEKEKEDKEAKESEKIKWEKSEDRRKTVKPKKKKKKKKKGTQKKRGKKKLNFAGYPSDSLAYCAPASGTYHPVQNQHR